MATLPLLIVQFFFFFFKINRLQAVDDIDKLCKFHKNLTTDADCIRIKTINAIFSLTEKDFFPWVIRAQECLVKG